MMTANILNEYCLNYQNPAVQSFANSMGGGVPTPPPNNAGYSNPYYNNPQAYQQPQGYYYQNPYYQQPQGYYYQNPYYPQPQYAGNVGYYSSAPQSGYDPSLAQQINYQNNMQQQTKTKERVNIATPGLTANAGKKKLYYSYGKCYAADGSDGNYAIDELGRQIEMMPHAYDRKYLKEEFRNRQHAMIEYVREKDLRTYYSGTVMQEYELINQTPDPDEPGFEWDIVDQMRTVAERQNQPHDTSDAHYYSTVQQMYNEGKISFAKYVSCANGGIEHTNDNGYHAYGQPTYKAFGLGGMGAGYYYNNEYYAEQQKLQENHMKTINKLQGLVDRLDGLTEKEVIERDELAEKNAINDYYRMALQHATEAQQNAFVAFVKSGKQSDEKDYISPTKQKVMESYNKTYEERHKNIDPNMSFKDFMCNGGYADMCFDDLKWQNRQKMNNLVRIYDDFFCKNGINQIAYFYDVFNATSPKGVTIKDGELHIELPPEMAARQYTDRRQTFFDKIYKHKNSAILPTDTEYFSGQYAAPPNPSGWCTTPPTGYYQNTPPGYMRM